MGRKYNKKSVKKNDYKRYRKNPGRSVIQRFNNKILNDTTVMDIVVDIDKDISLRKLLIGKNNRIIRIFGIFLFFLSAGVVFLLNYPFIEINGDKEIILKYNSEYVEEGVSGHQLFNDISNDIVITNDIDINKVGKYSVTYSYKYLGLEIRKNRNVIVVDDVMPQISLDGESEVSICPNDDYNEQGFKAIDEYDGDITDKVIRDVDDSLITYFVEDSSGNSASVSRKIIKEDKDEPVLTLKGSKTIYIYKDNKYSELGYSAMDNCDGDITKNVIITNNVNTNKVGSYEVSYKVSDSSGNTTIEKRNVIVREIVKVKPDDTSGSVIYLTFDDGPSNSITSKLLDILKEEDVKATFFVISGCSNFNSLVRREYNEGHTVALHSYTHKYDSIYHSVDAYYNDLNKIRNQVYAVTGEYSNIIRFPGGSSNTISKRYSVGIMSTLVNSVLDNGYHYFDWNISSGDAGGVSSSEEVYNNVINGLKYNRSNVVLMHDFENNYYTLNAIRDIIRYGKENGYTFLPITMNTKEVHHTPYN